MSSNGCQVLEGQLHGLSLARASLTGEDKALVSVHVAQRPPCAIGHSISVNFKDINGLCLRHQMNELICDERVFRKSKGIYQ